MDLENVIIQYKGFFNYEVLNKLLTDFFVYVNKRSIDISIYKKIQIVMIEMLENNYQYIQSIENRYNINELEPEFELVKINSGYKLRSSNPVSPNDAYLLKSHIDKFNDLSNEEIQKKYKEILREGMYVEKISDGIGLLRIAKISGNKIKYSFKKINNNLLYYTLEITVS